MEAIAEKTNVSQDSYRLTLCERVRRFEDEAEPHLRGLIATRIYRDQSEMPAVKKRAEIMARTLESLEPVILPEERIIGVAYRRFRVHGGIGDFDLWRIRALYPERHGFREEWPLPAEVQREMRWWNEKQGEHVPSNPLRKKYRWLWKYALAHPHGNVNGHTLPDHGILLNAGIGTLRERIGARLAERITASQRDELEAMDRSLEGFSGHIRLCAAAARAKADALEDKALAERLREAAANCDIIAKGAPQTFPQALQLLYFSNFADRMDTPGDASSYGRVDQLLWPFYKADLERGTLTEGEAFDWVTHFLIKAWAAQPSNNMTIGGQTPEGRDATNALSYMILEGMEATEMVVDLTVRLHSGAPPSFWETATRVVRRGFGRPSLYHDEVTIEALTRKGVKIEDARDYAPLGCVEVMIPGRSTARTMCMGMNLPKVLELILNEGRCLVTGDQIWDTPADFETFDEFLETYRAHVRNIIETSIESIREDERIEPMAYPRPWLSVLSRGGIESGVDMTAGQPKYNPVGVTLDGIAEIVNALYAVKHLVFEKKRITLDEFRKVLRANWQGYESLRQYVINRLPRFGQDDPAINTLARDEAAHYARCFESNRTYYGGRFWPMIFGVTTSMMHGAIPKTGATASGRREGEPLAQSLQPNLTGPQPPTTALLRSAAAIDYVDFAGGISNVQECNPSFVEGEAGLKRLEALIRGFFDLGGMELSLNLLREETLREAQRDPDRHGHLMVRVFGLSARFVDLSSDLQEIVIERVASAGRRLGERACAL